MEKRQIISFFKRGKIFQLIAVIVIAVAFFITLVCNSTLRENIYTNSSLKILCIFIWLLLIVYLVGIFFDFYKLKSFSTLEDKNEMQRYIQESSGMLNRFSCDNLFNSEEVKEVLSKVGCAMLEISNLPAINNEFGRDAGDIAINEFCEMLENVGNDYGIVVRNGGNEFLIVIANCTAELMERCLGELNNSIDVYNETSGNSALDIRSSYVLNADNNFTRFSEVITLAYHQLHK